MTKLNFFTSAILVFLSTTASAMLTDLQQPVDPKLVIELQAAQLRTQVKRSQYEKQILIKLLPIAQTCAKNLIDCDTDLNSLVAGLKSVVPPGPLAWLKSDGLEDVKLSALYWSVRSGQKISAAELLVYRMPGIRGFAVANAIGDKPARIMILLDANSYSQIKEAIATRDATIASRNRQIDALIKSESQKP